MRPCRGRATSVASIRRWLAEPPIAPARAAARRPTARRRSRRRCPRSESSVRAAAGYRTTLSWLHPDDANPAFDAVVLLVGSLDLRVEALGLLETASELVERRHAGRK